MNQRSAIVAFWLWLFKFDPALSETENADASFLESVVNLICEEKLNERLSDTKRKKLARYCRGYIRILLAYPVVPQHVHRPLLFLVTRRTITRISRLTGLSVLKVEDAWQMYSDWRNAEYRQMLPTDTWRAFRSLL